jgi:hypothetical protein
LRAAIARQGKKILVLINPPYGETGSWNRGKGEVKLGTDKQDGR